MAEETPSVKAPFDMPPASAGFDARGGWVVNRLMGDLPIKDFHAAGIVGNLGGESGLQAIQEVHPISGRGGWGWEQATGDRRVNFEQFCAEKGFQGDSDEANYDFIIKELLSTESHALRQLQKTTDLQAATYTFEVLFERPSDPQGGLAARVAFARRALVAANRARPPPSAPIPPTAPPRLSLPPPPRAPGADQPSPDPAIEILRPLPVTPSISVMNHINAAQIGAVGSSVPAYTAVKTLVWLLSFYAVVVPDELQGLWLGTLVLLGGLVIHSKITAALRNRVVRDLA